ncbi:hypothetical protein GmHk_13G037893 [Glycine max]|nr:hypothetical protein GmHk_13G037893 [Glycine max]
MFIKTKISTGICGSVDQHEKFITSDKTLANTLIMKFSSLRLTSVKGVREYIMKIRDISKLEVDMSESFLMHFILNTLLHEYGPFKIFYNTHKDKWSINELMTMCVQEEERLVMEMGESTLLTTAYGKNKVTKSQANKKGNDKIPPQANIKKVTKCFFYEKNGHMKKNCPGFQKWLEKKVKSILLVCYESNMISVNINTRWIHSGSIIHIANSLQDRQNLRKLVGSEQSILSGNKLGSPVEAIETCILTLSSDFILKLERTFYIPNMDAHGQKYFIIFIDDYSQYMNVYLLYNKNEALDAFKVFKAQVYFLPTC